MVRSSFWTQQSSTIIDIIVCDKVHTRPLKNTMAGAQHMHKEPEGREGKRDIDSSVISRISDRQPCPWFRRVRHAKCLCMNLKSQPFSEIGKVNYWSRQYITVGSTCVMYAVHKVSRCSLLYMSTKPSPRWKTFDWRYLLALKVRRWLKTIITYLLDCCTVHKDGHSDKTVDI